MISTRMWRALGIGGAIMTSLLLLGVLNALFEVQVGTNLFSTGITPAIIFGIFQLILAFTIYKNYI